MQPGRPRPSAPSPTSAYVRRCSAFAVDPATEGLRTSDPNCLVRRSRQSVDGRPAKYALRLEGLAWFLANPFIERRCCCQRCCQLRHTRRPGQSRTGGAQAPSAPSQRSRDQGRESLVTRIHAPQRWHLGNSLRHENGRRDFPVANAGPAMASLLAGRASFAQRRDDGGGSRLGCT